MLTAENEKSIRRALSQKKALINDVGSVIPAPIYFADRADFFATTNPLLTKKLIETTPIVFCAISLLKFQDFPGEGCADNPLVRLTYNFYLFREYGLERADESEDAPDDFLMRTLLSYNAFIKTILDARVQFLGLQDIASAGLPGNFDVKTNSLAQKEYIEERAPCRYVPGAKGHSVDLETVVEVLINEEDE